MSDLAWIDCLSRHFHWIRTEGVDDPHLHTVLHEAYLVAKGNSEVRVGLETIQLEPGDVLVVEPNEPHTFLSSSPDYFHFVIQTPGTQGKAAQAEKSVVPRTDLGL
jgi:quercetin dioxygenase-like cupin family protein